MIFEIISGGEKSDWVGKEWAGLFFPRGKNWLGGKFRPVTPVYTSYRGSQQTSI